MQFRALIAAAVVASFSFAAAQEEVLRVDYPKVCGSYCGPPVTASHACGEKGVQCVCDTKHMKKLIPLCEACTKVQSGPQNQNYHQNVLHVLNECGFKKSTREFTDHFSGAAGLSAPALGAAAIAGIAAVVAI